MLVSLLPLPSLLGRILYKLLRNKMLGLSSSSLHSFTHEKKKQPGWSWDQNPRFELFFGSVLCTPFYPTKRVAIRNCLFHRHSWAPTLLRYHAGHRGADQYFITRPPPSRTSSLLCFSGEHKEVADTVILGDGFL